MFESNVRERDDGTVFYVHCARPHLKLVYKQHNRAFYAALHRNVERDVESAIGLLEIDSPDGTGSRRVCGEEHDACSIIDHWMQYNLQYGFREEDSVRNAWVYAYSSFDSGPIAPGVDALQAMMKKTRAMKDLKLSWRRVISRIARTIQPRHGTFGARMEKWVEPPPGRGAGSWAVNCIDKLQEFFADIKHMAKDLEGELTDNQAVKRQGSRVLFQAHYDMVHREGRVLAGRGGYGEPPGAFKRGGGKKATPAASTDGPALKCSAKDCGEMIDGATCAKMHWTVDGDHLCDRHFKQMIREDKVMLQNGKYRYKRTNKGGGRKLTASARAYIQTVHNGGGNGTAMYTAFAANKCTDFGDGSKNKGQSGRNGKGNGNGNGNGNGADKNSHDAAASSVSMEQFTQGMTLLARAVAEGRNASTPSVGVPPTSQGAATTTGGGGSAPATVAENSTNSGQVDGGSAPGLSYSNVWEDILQQGRQQGRQFMLREGNAFGTSISADKMVSAPPADDPQYAWWVPGVQLVELIVDSGTTVTTGSTKLHSAMPKAVASRMRLTGAHGKAKNCGMFGSLQLIAFNGAGDVDDERKRGEVTLPVHTMEGGNANLLCINQLEGQGFHSHFATGVHEIYTRGRGGARDWFPAEWHKEGQCRITRALVSEDPAAARRVREHILAMVKAGKRWQWYEGEFLTPGLGAAAMITSLKAKATAAFMGGHMTPDDEPMEPDSASDDSESEREEKDGDGFVYSARVRANILAGGGPRGTAWWATEKVRREANRKHRRAGGPARPDSMIAAMCDHGPRSAVSCTHLAEYAAGHEAANGKYAPGGFVFEGRGECIEGMEYGGIGTYSAAQMRTHRDQAEILAACRSVAPSVAMIDDACEGSDSDDSDDGGADVAAAFLNGMTGNSSPDYRGALGVEQRASPPRTPTHEGLEEPRRSPNGGPVYDVTHYDSPEGDEPGPPPMAPPVAQRAFRLATSQAGAFNMHGAKRRVVSRAGGCGDERDATLVRQTPLVDFTLGGTPEERHPMDLRCTEVLPPDAGGHGGGNDGTGGWGTGAPYRPPRGQSPEPTEYNGWDVRTHHLFVGPENYHLRGRYEQRQAGGHRGPIRGWGDAVDMEG
jgi:hypothetical protein